MTMDGRCETCQFWDTARRRVDYDSDIAAKAITKDAYNPEPDRGYCMEPNEAKMTVHYRGYCDEGAWLMTAPDFGCVQWQAKDDAPSGDGLISTKDALDGLQEFAKMTAPPFDIGWEFYVRIYEVGAVDAWAKLTEDQRDHWREIARDFLETCCPLREQDALT